MTGDSKVICLSEALTPISHAKGSSGNVSLVNTAKNLSADRGAPAEDRRSRSSGPPEGSSVSKTG